MYNIQSKCKLNADKTNCDGQLYCKHSNDRAKREYTQSNSAKEKNNSTLQRKIKPNH